MIPFHSDKPIRWNETKSKRLKKTRGVDFKELLGGRLVKRKVHPTRSNQDVFLIYYRNYIWVIPFVEVHSGYFLKTLYPSRKYTRLFEKGVLV